MDMMSAEQENMDLLLTQMGAKVESVHGLICFAKFTISDVEISYVYSINANNKYYLQKIRPYPVGAGEFSRSSEVVDYIKKDIENYKVASKSSAFHEFVSINQELHQSMYKLEELFLQYNVPHDKLGEIGERVKMMNQLLSDIQYDIQELKLEK